MGLHRFIRRRIRQPLQRYLAGPDYLRFRDRLRVGTDFRLAALHRTMNAHLARQAADWPHYAYARGYFYQGWDRLRVTGARRSVELRWADYNLDKWITPSDRVLDVGANCAFLACAIAQRAHQVVAVEFNPYLMAIGRDVAAYLDLDNIDCVTADFMELDLPGPFDVILSCANHFTDDGNMRPDFRAYMEKLHSLLAPTGRLLFESHSVDVDNPDFDAQFNACLDLYRIRELRRFDSAYGGDGSRLYYVLEPHPSAGSHAEAGTAHDTGHSPKLG